jgi:hypothetical protein
MTTDKPPMRNLTVRIEQAEHELLEAQGAQVGLSGPMHARELLRSALHQWHGKELHTLAADIESVRTLLLRQGAELRLIVQALLVAAGMEASNAREWTERNLGPGSKASE